MTRIVELLSVPDCDVVIASLIIMRTFCIVTGCDEEFCMGIGLMDALDALEYSGGTPEVRRFASDLTNELFKEKEGYFTSNECIQQQWGTIALGDGVFGEAIDLGSSGTVSSFPPRGAQAVRPAWMM